ncbi:MAG TPA: ribulokinase [Candidatus Glassbacteria bacterium]|nr:ribulokinase [Candidatus Glassbacteria bacterium]
MERSFVIGVDFGTDSVRALVADTSDGSQAGAAVAEFSRWSDGLYCDPAANRFRQHPLDHIESLERAVAGALKDAGAGAAGRVAAISVDTTGSTPGPLDSYGAPLGLDERFAEDPDALFVLWKDHTSVDEAAEINRAARSWGGTDFTMYSGGVYSSEWFWSKILHVCRRNAAVRQAAHTWIEHCDWVPWLLCGGGNPAGVRRSRCAAGHKAMWHASFDGLPSAGFLKLLDPHLAELCGRLYTDTWTADKAAGRLSVEWAGRLELAEGLPVGVGAFDAHMGAVGAQIEPYALTKVIGTSTCDMLVAPYEDVGDRLVRGICGQVDGSVIPGLVGMEAGQSAFGDVYAWFRDLLAWPLDNLLPEHLRAKGGGSLRSGILRELTRQAEQLPPEETTVLALDWLNGRRTPDADQRLKGALAGLTLGSSAPRMFKALVESTAYGSRLIVERFEREGIKIRDVIALGGVATRSAYVMQVLADVLGRRIRISACEQACALGAAMFAATVAGIYPDVQAAQQAMGAGFSREFTPRAELTRNYDRVYERYRRLGNFVEKETNRPLDGGN